MGGDIFLLTADSLRRDVLGCYGGPVDTPAIEALSEDAVQFSQAISQGPYTATAFPAILFSTFMINYHQETFKVSGTSLASRFREEGLRTVGVHTNPYISSRYGYDTGFDRFNEFEQDVAEMRSGVTWLKQVLERMPGMKSLARHLYLQYNYHRGNKPYLDGAQIVDGLLDEVEDDPVFGWAHFMDAHFPYMPDDAFRTQGRSRRRDARLMAAIKAGKTLSDSQLEEVRSLYRASIRTLDTRLDRFISRLKEQGRYEDATIVFTADHGEEFGEHGRYLHGDRLYDELVRVPLLVKTPGNKPGQVEAVTELRDLGDIIRKTRNHELPAVNRERAVSGCGRLIGGEKKRSVSVRTATEKIIVHEHRKNEYYRLDTDPAEQDNRYGEDHDTTLEEKAEAALESGGSGAVVEKDVEAKRRLRELGYVE